MALWKDQYGREHTTPEPGAPEKDKAAAPVNIESARQQPAAQARTDANTKESLLASGLTIEGKIEGAGHVRIAGNFKGDVHVQGNLTIESGAKVTGGVRAHTVVVGGELEGNIVPVPNAWYGVPPTTCTGLPDERVMMLLTCRVTDLSLRRGAGTVSERQGADPAETPR